MQQPSSPDSDPPPQSELRMVQRRTVDRSIRRFSPIGVPPRPAEPSFETEAETIVWLREEVAGLTRDLSSENRERNELLKNMTVLYDLAGEAFCDRSFDGVMRFMRVLDERDLGIKAEVGVQMWLERVTKPIKKENADLKREVDRLKAMLETNPTAVWSIEFNKRMQSEIETLSNDYERRFKEMENLINKNAKLAVAGPVHLSYK